MKYLSYISVFLIIFGSFIFTSCDNEPIEFSPVAKFSVLTVNNEVVEFRNTSLNSTSWHWDFGDGNTSTEKDPTHIYAEIGNYEVVLTAYLDGKSDLTSGIAIVTAIFPMELTELDKPPFGQRAEGISFSYEGKGYCGFGTSGFLQSNDLWRFDPSDQSWTQLSEAPKEFVRGVSFVIDGSVYMGLGRAPWGIGASEFYKYDIASDTYTSIGMFPTNSSSNQNWVDAVGFSYNGKGYVMGASGTFGDPIRLVEFNPNDNSWETISNPPVQATSGYIHFVKDGYLYVGMGGEFSSAFNTTQDFWKYDIENNVWTQLSDFSNEGRTEAISFFYEGKGYCGFGFRRDTNTGVTESFSDLWEYNVMADEWTRIESMPISAIKQHYHFVLENKFYFGGGYDAGNSSLSDFYEYEF